MIKFQFPPWEHSPCGVLSSSVAPLPTACSPIMSAPYHRSNRHRNCQILQIDIFVFFVKNLPPSRQKKWSCDSITDIVIGNTQAIFITSLMFYHLKISYICDPV